MTTNADAPADASRPDTIGQDRVAYLVLGMHRSGTSAITQVLALAGAELPENTMAGDEHNEGGYFEPWKIAIFNDERLRAGGSAWDDVFAHPYRPLAPADEQAWTERAAALFDQEYGIAGRPLLKDPRVTVLLPLWRAALGLHGVAARCVIPVRHPLEVAGSLARRDGFTPEKSVLLWAAYMLAAEAGSRDLPRAFVSYPGLLADWRGTVARIEASHGAPLPNLNRRAEREIERFLSPDLRHNKPTGRLSDLGWAGELAGEVCDWFEAAAQGEAADHGRLDALTRRLEARQAEIGPLISPTARDFDAARSELLHARQLAVFEQRRREAMEQQVARLTAQVEFLESACETANSTLDAILEGR